MMFDRRTLPPLHACLVATAFLAVTMTASYAQDGQQMPPPAVSVLELKEKSVPVMNELGQVQGGEWLVESGLKSGEQVVVDGVQKVQPGGKVAPEPWMPADTSVQSPDQTPHATK